MEREIPNQELLDKLHLGAETLRLESEDLLRRVEELHHERERYMSAIELIKSVCLEAGNEAGEATASTNATNPETDLSDLIIDFDGAQNHAERVQRIGVVAKKNGRLLNVTVVTQLMIDRGQVRSTVINMRPTIHKILDSRPNLYNKIGPGTYDYIEIDPEANPSLQVEQPSLTSTGEVSLNRIACQEGDLPVSRESCEEDEVK